MPPPDQRSLKALASLKPTPREAEVLSWISDRKTNQEIGVIAHGWMCTRCRKLTQRHVLPQ